MHSTHTILKTNLSSGKGFGKQVPKLKQPCKQVHCHSGKVLLKSRFLCLLARGHNTCGSLEECLFEMLHVLYFLPGH